MLYQKSSEFGLKEGELSKALAKGSREVVLVVQGKHYLLHSIEANEQGIYLHSDVTIPHQQDLFEGRDF
jgi:hypothetical protein